MPLNSFFLDFSCLNNLPFGGNRILNSPSIMVLSSTYALTFSSVYFIKYDTLMFGAYVFRNVQYPLYRLFPLSVKSTPFVSS